jgi:ABC-type transport system involved in multi-copper enzyme maturation permease subunit
MFLRLFSVELTRLFRRWMPWLILAASAFYTGLGMQNYYTSNRLQLLSGETPMPGLSFDLATSLDLLPLVLLPLLVILAASMMGSDYAQRTNQLWLTRVSRQCSLLAKFALLALVALGMQALTLLASGAVAWYYRANVFGGFSAANVNYSAVLLALLYMTLALMPYLALMLLITVASRSSFAGVIIGLGYTQFVELILTAVLHGRPWMAWYPHNLAASVSYLLNGIGNRVVEAPAYYARPLDAVYALMLYTLLFLSAAVWLYRRQDVGG